MGSHHLVTVCMFCLLCATHTSCSVHAERLQKDFRRIQDIRHEKYKSSLEDDNINRNYARTLVKIRKDAEVPREENVIEESNRIDENLNSRLTNNVEELQNNFQYNEKFNNKFPTRKQNQIPINSITRYETNRDPIIKRRMKRRMKRSSNLSQTNNGEDIIKPAPLEQTDNLQYTPSLKNIDIDFYIKKLFIQFGDRDTMTMNIHGFEKMLRKLDLNKMILEKKDILQGNAEANDTRPNSSNVKCVNSVDLVVSVTHQKSKFYDSIESTTNQFNLSGESNLTNIDVIKQNTVLSSRMLTQICPILLYQKVAQSEYEKHGCIVEREFPKFLDQHANYESLVDNEEVEEEKSSYDTNRTAVWIYSSLCILAISACGLLGVAVIPIMDHMYYQQILQFLVALAIGTLSGDAMLHLLPHALVPDEHGHSHHHHEHSSHEPHSHDSMWKGLVAVLGVVFFYFTEKGLTLVAEWRKRKMRLNKENKLPSRVRVMRNDSFSCLKGSGSCSSRNSGSGFLRLPMKGFFKSNKTDMLNDKYEANTVKSEKVCKHKYSEYPYCYDEIATDTLDDHHVVDSHLNSAGKHNHNLKKYLATAEDTDHLSVVSLNNVKENKNHIHNHEPTANDSLIVHNYDDSIVETQTSKNQIVPSNINQSDNITEDTKNSVKVINDKKHDPKDTDDIDEKKNSNDRESYTVILREHSQTHHGHSHSHGHVHSPPSSLSSVVWMVIMGDGLHNFTDGMAIGAAFSSNIAGGFSTAIAVLCHELPHEIGDFAVLLKAGMSAKRAVFYNLLSSILCLFGMILGVIVGHAPEATAWVFAAAAGMFMYIALVDMIPELTSSHTNEDSLCQCLLQFAGLASGIGIMLLIAMYEHELKKLFG